jgi:small subunit ribosomal protein S13
MARIAGVDLPRNKRIEIALTYVYGIGRKSSNDILQRAGIDPDKREKDLTESELAALRDIVDHDYVVEGELRRDVQMKHQASDRNRLLPWLAHRATCRTWTTDRTNARTKRGPKRRFQGAGRRRGSKKK